MLNVNTFGPSPGTQTQASPTTWTLDRSESYGYDPNFDYLTSANYGDGLANPTPAWTYDDAGNRTDSVCDNLPDFAPGAPGPRTAFGLGIFENRATSVGGVSSTNDILGNRLTLGSTSYSWDCLNRLGGIVFGLDNSISYTYRADGMRVGKMQAIVPNQSIYRYDGQMSFEDIYIPQIGTTTVTDYGLGARGINEVFEGSSASKGVE